jgi:hypothetical protein
MKAHHAAGPVHPQKAELGVARTAQNIQIRTICVDSVYMEWHTFRNCSVINYCKCKEYFARKFDACLMIQSRDQMLLARLESTSVRILITDVTCGIIHTQELIQVSWKCRYSRWSSRLAEGSKPIHLPQFMSSSSPWKRKLTSSWYL